MNGRNPVMTWCMTVSSLTATLAGTLALGSGNALWQHLLFVVVLLTTIPVLGYFLLIGIYHTSRWSQRQAPVLPWRRVHWSIPVSAVAIGVVVLGISQLGGSHGTPTLRTSGSRSATALIGPRNTENATDGFLAPPGTVKFSADGKTVSVDDCADKAAKGKAAGLVYMWNVATGKLETSLSVPPHGHPDCGNMPVTAFSRDGKFLAVGDTNSDVTYVLHAGNDRLAVSHDTQYGGLVADITFSPNSRILAVADADGNTALWRFWPLAMETVGPIFGTS